MKSKIFVRVVLIAVLAASVFSLVLMRLNIRDTDKEMSDISGKIEEQKLRNNELQDLLSEDHKDDFYKDAAEEYFGYGDNDEKIYIDVTGQ